ncbi:unnamed protein product [Brugia timori]|uniref:LigA n=1 Tax=Brugia timori TaxID=42155 RepID=A0A0R3Q9D0_9BILA|nr:unnamed protein product [Brugia timori]
MSFSPVPGHGFDQRHWPGDREGARASRREHRSQRARRHRRRPTRTFGKRCQNDAPRGRHARPRADRRTDEVLRFQLRSRRHTGQQRGDPACGERRGVPGPTMGRNHRGESFERLPHHATGTSSHARRQLGKNHQRGVDPRPGGLGAEVGLCGGEAWHRWIDQGSCARDRNHRHHLQRDLPWGNAHALGAKADRRSSQARRRLGRRDEGQNGRREATFPGLRHRRAIGRTSRVHVFAERGSSPRRCVGHGWRLDGTVAVLCSPGTHERDMGIDSSLA